LTTLTVADLQEHLDASMGAGSIALRGQLDTTYQELGVDSLTLYEMVTRIQDQLRVPITDEQIELMKTPQLTIDTVNAQLSSVA
jgi:acyl carrier protein